MCITHISLGRAVARILVIDDDASVRGLLEFVLQTDGHEVKVAASAMEDLPCCARLPSNW